VFDRFDAFSLLVNFVPIKIFNFVDQFLSWLDFTLRKSNHCVYYYAQYFAEPGWCTVTNIFERFVMLVHEKQKFWTT